MRQAVALADPGEIILHTVDERVHRTVPVSNEALDTLREFPHFLRFHHAAEPCVHTTQQNRTLPQAQIAPPIPARVGVADSNAKAT